MFIVVLILLLITYKTTYSSNETDSLQKLLQQARGEERIEILIQLASKKVKTNPAEVVDLYQQALKHAEAARDDRLIMQVKMALGHYYTFHDYNAGLAKDFTRQAFRLSEKLNDSASMATLFTRFGIIYGRNNEFDSALYYLNIGQPVIERHSDNRDRSRAYNTIGNIYLKGFRDYRKAIEYYLKALEENILAGDRHGIATNCLNIANAYDELGDTEKALLYVNTGLNAAEEVGATDLIHDLYNCKAVIHTGLRQFKQALKAHREAIRHTDVTDLETRAIVYNNISIIYLKTEQFDSAYYVLNKARKLSEHLRNMELKSSIEFHLHEYYSHQSQPLRALEHLRAYAAYSDTLHDQINTQTLSEQMARFETEKRQKEIETENLLKAARIRLLKGQLLLALAAVVVIIVIFFWAYMLKKHHIKVLNEQKKQVERTGDAINAINQIGKRLTGNLNPLLMMDVLYKSLKQLAPVDLFAIGLYNKNTHTLDFHDAWEADRKLPPYSFHVEDEFSFEGFCFAYKKMLVINNVEESWREYFPGQVERNHKSCNTAGSLIYIPLTINDTTLGVLTVQSYRNNAYDKHHASYLQNLAHFFSIALENANNYILILEVRNKLAKSLNELQISEISLKKSNKAKDRLFSVIAHDLKNPFNIIMGYVDLLCEEYENISDVQRIEYLENTRQASLMLFKLLQNLLEWSQLQAGRQEFNPQELLIHPILDEIISLFQIWANDKKVTVRNSLGADVKISADIDMIKTVFRNLIANAIKYSYKGGEVNIGCRRTNGKIEFYVQDFGVGMTAEQISKLFNAGEQNHTAGTATEPGSGLGLLLCHDFIQQHRGTIWVESIPGKGSIFYFTLQPSENSDSIT